jgi:hypothetical protein
MARRDPGGPTRRTALAALLGAAACRATTRVAPPHAPGDFLDGALRERGRGLLAVTDPDANRFAIYDSALAALVLLRRGRRDDAGRLLAGLSALQYDDGALPFSFTGAGPDRVRFVRAGAVAWVGYAAAEYLDADVVAGRDRDLALHLAHQAAGYLLRARVAAPGDPRDGLIAGGEGDLRYEISDGKVHEAIEPGALAWVSVEHNIDAYFFLRALARVSDTADYAEAATRLGSTLIARAWHDARGQFARGVGTHGRDDLLALDCAAWGAVFLVATGDQDRARIAFATAEQRYASRDPHTGATGHRPYAEGPVFEDPRLQRFYQRSLPAPTWERIAAVWPEGSAGVALAALRTGRADRAREILDAIEPLRLAGGAMPTFTLEVPFTFDTDPSVAGTAWVELVRFELARDGNRPTLWVP